MGTMIQILLAFVFYGMMWFFYTYSQGNYKVKEDKQEHYAKWVEKNGERVSKAIRVLIVIFTVLLILNWFVLI